MIDSSGRSFHEQSHGESFFGLMTHRFRGSGLHARPPETALSACSTQADIVGDAVIGSFREQKANK